MKDVRVVSMKSKARSELAGACDPNTEKAEAGELLLSQGKGGFPDVLASGGACPKPDRTESWLKGDRLLQVTLSPPHKLPLHR